MVKKSTYLIIILALLIGAGVLVAIAPYHIYTLTLTEGVDTRFLEMGPTKAVLYDGNEIIVPTPSDMNDESLFQTFHFSHYELPIPMNHTLYNLIPLIKIEGQGLRLGSSFQNGKNVELFSYMIEKPYKFETTSAEQKLFSLPIFKNYISRKSSDEVWADLFKKKLSLPSNEGKSFYESLLTLRKVNYNDLVYNLYILNNRRFFIPESATKMSFYNEKNMGIAELPSKEDRVLVERLYIIEKGIVYPILIKTRKSDSQAVNFRAKFIREINYKNSSKDSAISIYARYKQIPFAQRVDQQGMTYLYSAWSHDVDNKDFVRVIISFLERGEANLKYLTPFYTFAYKKFGSSLSASNSYLNETAPESLKRKITEELDSEVKKETNQLTGRTEGQFSTPDDNIKFNLQKARDNKVNSDDNDKVLIME